MEAYHACVLLYCAVCFCIWCLGIGGDGPYSMSDARSVLCTLVFVETNVLLIMHFRCSIDFCCWKTRMNTGGWTSFFHWCSQHQTDLQIRRASVLTGLVSYVTWKWLSLTLLKDRSFRSGCPRFQVKLNIVDKTRLLLCSWGRVEARARRGSALLLPGTEQFASMWHLWWS